MMTSAVTMPLYGQLSDVYGRRPFFLFGPAVFIAGSALSGQARGMMELILFRGLRGVGGGAMLIMPRATVGDIFNPKELGKGMGLILSVYGLATIIVPFLGRWITGHWSWRWIFYINLPVALAVIGAMYYALPSIRREARFPVDWSGSAMLILGLIPILLAFTWAGRKYAWQSWPILGLFALGVLILAAFVGVERKAAEPVSSVSSLGAIIISPIYDQNATRSTAKSRKARNGEFRLRRDDAGRWDRPAGS
jgi:MFS family permease